MSRAFLLEETLSRLGFTDRDWFCVGQKRDGDMVSKTFPRAPEGIADALCWLNEEPEADTYYTINPLWPRGHALPTSRFDDDGESTAFTRVGSKGKANDADVARYSALLIDIDPKDTGEDSRTKALEVAAAVFEEFYEDLETGHFQLAWVSSGRGQQLILRVDFWDHSDHPDVTEATKALEEAKASGDEEGIAYARKELDRAEGVNWDHAERSQLKEIRALRKRLTQYLKANYDCGSVVKIDATSDVSRFARLPGSVNSRTGEEVYVRDWGGWGDPDDTIWVLDEDGELTFNEEGECDFPRRAFTIADLADRVPLTLEAADKEVGEYGTWDTGTASGREIKQYVLDRKDTPLPAIWFGHDHVTDRDARDARFLGELLRTRTPINVAQRLLNSLPGAKIAADNRTDEGYRNSIWQRAHRIAGQERRDQQTVRKLQALVSDETHPPAKLTELLTSKAGIEALIGLRIASPQGFGSVRQKIKDRQLWPGGVTAFDATIKEKTDSQVARNTAPPDAKLVFVTDGKGQGFLLRRTDGQWLPCKEAEAKRSLKHSRLNSEASLAAAEAHPWLVDSVPFEPARKLDGRRWNLSLAQLRYPNPTPGPHDAWNAMLDHLGRGIDEDVRRCDWCRSVGINTGSDYLRTWIGSMLQDPAGRRAMIFLFSAEYQTGKSTLSASLRDLILIEGATQVDECLREKFNGNLEGKVLGYVEETDLSARGAGRSGGRSTAYNKIKDLVTGKAIAIRAMQRDSFEVPNTISLIMTANSPSFCPVYPGDNRITFIEVSPLPEGTELGAAFTDKLEAEAEAFTAAMLALEVPASNDRLVVPCIDTAAKRAMGKANETFVAAWIRDHPEHLLMSHQEICTALGSEAATVGGRAPDPQHVKRVLVSGEWRDAQAILGDLKARKGKKAQPGEIAEAIGLPASKVGKLAKRMAEIPDGKVERRGIGGGRWAYFVPDDQNRRGDVGVDVGVDSPLSSPANPHNRASA
tara:strand:- start:2767 stop:5712 length:2946 start_codon:yes stop_codon:yes gene_type:complete